MKLDGIIKLMMRKKSILMIVISVVAGTVFAQDTTDYTVNKWEISVDEAVRTYIGKKEYTVLDIDDIKDYSNRIYNHLVTVNPDIRSRIRILRTRKFPVRDFLFIDGRFYEILEYRNGIDSIAFKELFVALKNIYGLPEMGKEDDFTVYTFKNERTYVVVVTRPAGDRYDAWIYLYGRALFRRMLTDLGE
jgi:hypothetical protein